MDKKKSHGLSIFRKLLIAFLIMVMTTGSLLTIVFFVYSKKSFQNHLKEQIIQQFKDLCCHFQHEVGLIKDIQVLSGNPLLDEFLMSSENDREIIARSLERLFLQSIHYDQNYLSIYFADPLGQQRVKVTRNGRAKTLDDISDSALFKRIEESPSGSLDIEGPSRDKKGNISFSIGIHKRDPDIGEFGGIVVIEYSLNKLLAHLDTIKIAGHNFIWLFTPSGQILQQPMSKEAVFDPRSGFTSGFQETPVFEIGNEGMIIYQDLFLIPERPLARIAISVPSSLLLKDIRAILRFFAVIFLLSLLMASGFAFALSVYLSRPIIELAQASSHLAKGNLSARVKTSSTGEVQMLIDSFNQMADDLARTTVSKEYLEKINNELNQFAYVVSHDLKAPLRAIANLSQWIKEDIDDKLTEEIRRQIDLLCGRVHRMEALINGILEYSRIGRLRVEQEMVDTRTLLIEIIDSMPIPEGFTVKIAPEMPSFYAPKIRLHQVFANLISNAVKYSDRDDGAVEIAFRKRGPFYEFSVADNGPGIAPRFHERIFMIFQTLTSRDTVESTGIGLTLVKKIVEEQGGSIMVESEEGKGTVFRFTWPEAPVEGKAA